jgi:pilus assembly protein CpaB
VVVAKARVVAWQSIKEPEKYFEVKQFPSSVAPKNALTDVAALKDQKLKTAVDEGKPVSLDDLADKSHRGLADMLQPGQRAVAIKVNAESLAGGFVQPGSRVDIICTTRGSDAQTSVILQNMLVLAVDTEAERSAEKKTLIGQTVTLAATPEEAVRLNLAKSVGELTLMLKNDTDTKRTSPVTARKGDLAKGYTPDARYDPEPIRAAPAPAPAAATPLPALPPDAPAPVEEPKAKPKPRPHVLTVIQGPNKERHFFQEGDEDEAAAGSTPSPTPSGAPKSIPKDAAPIKPVRSFAPKK